MLTFNHIAVLITGAAMIVPAAFASPTNMIATLHAEGAQVYECKTNEAGSLVWQFREPIATLFEDGKTIGRHYAGPHWELADGSVIAAKVASSAPGATANDIPTLQLDVTKGSDIGRLANVVKVERINTRGGVAKGPCVDAGEFLSVPYSADYALLGDGTTSGMRRSYSAPTD